MFVSSTFEDLVEERDRLQREVFPALQEFCLARGARFRAIDLRWGVSEQASVDQQAMNICLTEIARCRNTSPRPNFIVLLGDRYGWCPPPSEIPADEFTQILQRVQGPAERELLKWWYPRDDNAVPPIHYLRLREGELEQYEAWVPIERRLRSVLAAAVAGSELAGDRRFVASATEQEIAAGALTIADAAEHVFCLFRSIEGLPNGPSAGRFADLDENHAPDVGARDRLERLKDRLRSVLPGNVFDYTSRWSGDRPTYDHVDQLAADAKDVLLRVIATELERLEQVDPLDQELRRHEEFGAERASDFTGRDWILAQIANYIEGGEPRPLVIHGESGAGKSALIARAAAAAQREHPQAASVVRFIGTTPESTIGRDLLAGLCRQITRSYAAFPDSVVEEQRELLDESTVPSEYSDLAGEFPRRLALASQERPLIVFLDALDQLPADDPARRPLWLPSELPENVRIVISTTRPREEPFGQQREIAPSEPFAVLQSRLPANQLIPLERMDESEGNDLLDTWLGQSNRTLRPHQRRQVIDKFELEGLPLYLKLAFEQARLWRSDTPEDQTQLRIGIRGVIRGNLFARLAAEDQHGGTLVARSLGFLAAAKNGLTEDELLDLLSSDVEVLAEFRRRSPKSPVVDRLPPVVWSRLYFDLEPYLSERAADGTSLLTFYHRQLREVIEEDYLAGDAGVQRHRHLAAYFADDETQPLKRQADGSVTANLRRLAELPYQQTSGEMWDDIYTTLTDFDFLEVKAEHAGVIETTDTAGRVSRTYTGVYQLQDDYALALARMPGAEATRPKRRIIVTGTDFGDGLKLLCPHCNETSAFNQQWRGQDVDCPQCGGSLRVNQFIVARQR